MRAMKDFEQVGSRGFYRPIAHVSFEQAVDLVHAPCQHQLALACAEC